MIYDLNSFWEHTDTIDGWFFRKEAELLYLCASSVPEDQAIIEIGAYKGRSTSIMAFGSTGSHIYSIDPHDNESAYVEAGIAYSSLDDYNANLDRLGIDNTLVTRITGYSYLESEKYTGPKVGLLFIDGYHSAEAVIQDYESWEKHLADDAIVYFDDIHHGGVNPGIAQIEGRFPPIMKSADKSGAWMHQVSIDRQPLLNNY
jgi:predicted O-methyltransferase YrrM